MKKFHKIIEEIKSLSEQQNHLKTQRKTLHLKVERVMPASEAAYLVVSNSTKLMHLFIAYAKLREKEPQLPTKVTWDQELIKKLIEKYKVEVVE